MNEEGALRYLTSKDGKSNKFWAIEVSGVSLRITYGKEGTLGNSLKKDFGSEKICLLEAEKLIKEKLKKGYTDRGDVDQGTNENQTKTAVMKEVKTGGDTDSLLFVSLYYQDGGSDKVYNVGIEQEGNGYVVNFSFGRRGSTLQTGTKTSKPVSFESAKKIHAQLVNSKKSKGYTEGLSGTPYMQTNKEERISGVNCQLLNPIEEEDLEVYLENSHYGAQEKLDGNRVLIRKTGQNIEGINRKGLLIALPLPLHGQVSSFDTEFILDGEMIGDMFYPFDILSKDGRDLQQTMYHRRYEELVMLLQVRDAHSIQIVPLVTEANEKRSLIDKLRNSNKEGVVFKDIRATYKAGRPASGGAQVKFKFYKTATVMVEKVNLKRSVSMKMLENDSWKGVGNVTIPPNQEVPKENEIIEVRYLYAYPGGSLYQPTYLGIRQDCDEEDCKMVQLKYKPTE